jgi:hypothetical protein
MTIEKISIDKCENYVDISYSSTQKLSKCCGGFGSLGLYTYLIIHSIPEGARIYLNGKYVGETSKSLQIDKLKTYLVRLELEGYKSWEGQFKFDTFEQQENTTTLSR